MTNVARLNRIPVMCAAVAVAGAVLAAQAAPQAASGAKAKEVVALMSAKKLESFAARDPDNSGHYVAVFLVPQVQLLLVEAKYTRDNDIEFALYHKNYSTAYQDLRSGVFGSERFMVDDAQGDGLVAVPGKNPQQDSVMVESRKHVFDGLFDPKGKNAKKPSQDAYMKTFTDADAKYARLLDVLLTQLKAGGHLSGADILR